MRRFLVALSLLLVATSAAAQTEPSFPGCAACGVAGFVDIPATSATVSNADLLARRAAVEGWGFECVSGAPVDRVDLFVEDDAEPGIWHPVPSTDPNASTALTWSGYIARPDVVTAFSASCPAVTPAAGFVRWIDRDLPLGAHRFLFVLWKGPYHTPTPGQVGAIIKTLNIVP